jgi:hypothetical protein
VPTLVPRSAWHPGPPVSNDGVTARPYIGHFANGIAVHYTGSPSIARARTETAQQFMPRFQQTAINAKKSFEYNALIPPRTDGQVWEYAGEYMGAHAGEAGQYQKNNSTRYAIQFTIGVDNHPSYSNYDPSKPVRWEPLTDAMVDAFRWWVHELRSKGVVAWDCPITPDRHLPGRQTACPGEAVLARWADLLEPWQPPTEPQLPPEDDMAKIAKIRFRGYADQFALIPLGPDTNRRLDLEAQAPIVLDADRGSVERETGYPLTPTANGQ